MELKKNTERIDSKYIRKGKRRYSLAVDTADIA
ncbi:MAG: hypothetical protein ACJAVV_003691 [Alphaproteobacteria bacterium]|jgi:hypothetical protein